MLTFAPSLMMTRVLAALAEHCKQVYMRSLAQNLHRKGALAHLARAFDWQSRGGEFESRMLHKPSKDATNVASFIRI